MGKTSSVYVPAIDGLRAIAVLAVIIFHVDFLAFLPGGFTGVDMFFVISGYVISHSLSERSELSVYAYLKDFYRRRFLRIFPALLVVLLVSFVMSAMFMPQFWLSDQISRTGLAAFMGVSNVVLAWNTDTYFSPTNDLNPYVHTWSLGVEEQFYLIFPALYYLWARFRKQSLRVALMLPILALASLAYSAVQTSPEPLSAFYLLPSRFWELASGAILFQVIGARRYSLRSTWFGSLMLMCGFALVLAGFLFAGRNAFPFPWALMPVVGTLMMISAVVLPAEGFACVLHRLLQSTWVTYIGRLSYSLYLWHWPVAVFLRWTSGLELLVVQLLYPVIVFALAAGSYHWVETPIRSGRLVVLRRAWATPVMGLAAVSLFGGAAFWIANNPDRLSLSQTRDSYNWYAYKHFPREPINKIEDPALEGRQLFVIGDSHTAAYRTLLKIVSLRLGINIVEYEQGGCAVANLMAADPASCAARREAELKAIESQARPGDIVFLASLRMPELQGLDWTRSENEVLNDALSNVIAQHEAARASAEAVLTRLQTMKVQVLIDAPKPIFKSAASRCSDWFNAMNPVCAQGLTMPRDQLERLRAPQMQLLALLTREYPNLTVWDPFAILCPGPACSAYDANGLPLFFDSNHLSGHGNRVLEPSFTQTVLSMWKRSH